MNAGDAYGAGGVEHWDPGVPVPVPLQKAIPIHPYRCAVLAAFPSLFSFNAGKGYMGIPNVPTAKLGDLEALVGGRAAKMNAGMFAKHLTLSWEVPEKG